jgi:hypothetical protein
MHTLDQTNYPLLATAHKLTPFQLSTKLHYSIHNLLFLDLKQGGLVIREVYLLLRFTDDVRFLRFLENAARLCGDYCEVGGVNFQEEKLEYSVCLPFAVVNGSDFHKCLQGKVLGESSQINIAVLHYRSWLLQILSDNLSLRSRFSYHMLEREVGKALFALFSFLFSTITVQSHLVNWSADWDEHSRFELIVVVNILWFMGFLFVLYHYLHSERKSQSAVCDFLS